MYCMIIIIIITANIKYTVSIYTSIYTMHYGTHIHAQMCEHNNIYELLPKQAKFSLISSLSLELVN